MARDEKRREFLGAAARSLADFKRTGIAYTHADVKKYLVGKVAGKTPKRPKPIKVPRHKR